MFDYSYPDTRLRESSYRFHKIQAKVWMFPLIVANTLFYFFVAAIPIVFIKFRDARALLPLSLLYWMIVLSWLMSKKVRGIRSRHLILAEGYAKPFAEEIVAKARSEGRKFALFLRGFDLEARSIAPSGINIEFGFKEPKLYARPVEALLVEMLNKNLPLIALTDPRDPHPIGGAYRFQSVPTDWKQFVGELLPDAFPIIMHLTSSFTVGVSEELELLKHPAYSKKTVIIVGKNVASENSKEGKWEQRRVSKFDHVVFQQTDSVWSRKQEINFHHRLRECLQTLENNSQEKIEIVRKDQELFTVVTPFWWSKLLSFIRGPALGGIGSIIGIYYLIDPPFLSASKYDLLGLIGKLILTWIILVIVLSVLKGLLFIFKIIS